MDIEILLWLQAVRDTVGSCFNSFFAFITMIAVDYYMLVPGLILFWAVDKKAGIFGLSSYGFSSLENAGLKSAFCVYRPWIRNSRLKPLPEVMSGATGYSFPSGHSSSTSGFYGGLIAYFKKYKALCVVFAIMVFLTMFSRIYVGVHTPQDVLVGALTGIVAAFVVFFTDKLLQKRPNLDIVVLIVSLVLCILVVIFIYYRKYPLDYVDGKLLVDPKKMTIGGFGDPGRFFGIMIGWFIERRFIKFDISGTNIQKVLRSFVGGLLFIFYWTVVVKPLGDLLNVGIAVFLLQASAPLLFMTVYPLIFKAIENRKSKKAKA